MVWKIIYVLEIELKIKTKKGVCLKTVWLVCIKRNLQTGVFLVSQTERKEGHLIAGYIKR